MSKFNRSTVINNNNFGNSGIDPLTERSPDMSVKEQRKLTHKVRRLEELLKGYKHAKSVQYALLQLSELASSVTDMAVFYGAMHGVIGQLLNARNFYVVLVCPDTGQFSPVYYSDQNDSTSVSELDSSVFETGLTGYVYRKGEPLLVDQGVYERLVADGELEAHGATAAQWMGVPLMRGRKSIGVIAIQSYGYAEYSNSDKELLEFMSLHLVTAIDRVQQRELLEQNVRNRTRELSQLNHNLQLEIKERQRAEQLQAALFKISQITATAAPMEEFYHAIHEVLQTLIYAENCYIALLSDDKSQLDFPFYADAKHKHVTSRRLGRGLTEYVILKGEACLIDRKQADEMVAQGLISRRVADKSERSYLATSWLGAPLIINDEVIGVVTTQAYDHVHEYTHRDLDVLCFVSHHMAVAIQRKLANDQLRKSHDDLESKVLTRTQELRQSNLFLKLQIEERKKAEEKLYFEANHDALTGLPNRKMLSGRLAQAITHKKRHSEHLFAVLFIDLDRFKIINDTMGHHVGDQFLIEVSLRIAGCIRDNDILARLGGDEFVILLDMISSVDDAEEIAQRIITSVAKPFLINNQEIYSGASVGIAQCTEAYQTADDLLRDADAAMYQAKGMGRGRFIVFDETMHQRLVDDMNIDQALHRALKEKQIYPKYRPLNSSQSGELIGYDVATCWQNAEFGEVPPSDFTQLAESNGLVGQIDLLILEQVVDAMKPGGVIANSSIVAVHLSASHLNQGKSLLELLKLVTEANIDNNRLCFVFSEQNLLNVSGTAPASFKRIRNLGIKIAIEGFGSGVSSIGLLTQNNIDYVKVDPGFTRTLIKNGKNHALLQTLVTLSLSFNFKVILDGIDNEQLKAIATEYQVDIVKGEAFDNTEIKTPQQNNLVHLFA